MTFDQANLPPRIQPVLMLTFLMEVISAERFEIEPLPASQDFLSAERMT